MNFRKLSDSDFDTFTTQIVRAIPDVQQLLNVSEAEMEAMGLHLIQTHDLYTDYISRRAEADAAYKAFKEHREESESELSRFILLIKSDKKYTTAIGKELQIVSNPKAPIDTENAKTQLNYKIVAGIPHISFVKNGATGIKLYSRRGNETEFTLLSTVHQSPYIDNRPNLVANQPEVRQYRALLFLKDTEIGKMSDTIDLKV